MGETFQFLDGILGAVGFLNFLEEESHSLLVNPEDVAVLRAIETKKTQKLVYCFLLLNWLGKATSYFQTSSLVSIQPEVLKVTRRFDGSGEMAFTVSGGSYK